MKLLHVVSTAQRRGAEIFASDLAGELRWRGFDQLVAVVHGSSTPDVDFHAPARAMERGGSTVLRLRPRACWDLRALARTWRPDVIVAHGGEALKYTVVAGPTARLVYRRIGATPAWRIDPIRRVAYARLARKARLVIAVGEAARTEMVRVFRVPIERVVSIPNGVDPGRLEPRSSRDSIRRSLHIPPDALVVISVAALTWEKDPARLIRIGAIALAGIPGAIHLIVGEGPLRPEAEREAARRGGSGIRMLGSRTDVPDLLAASDLTLLASRTEGMPACLIEAAMAGLPAVASRVGSVSEVVIDGVTGLLAEPDDEDGLIRSVRRLALDDQLRMRMGGQARRWSGARFDISVVADAYVRQLDAVAVMT